MADGNITLTTAASWIDEIWSPELLTAVEFNIVVAGLFDDKSSLMPHGDVFHYPEVHNLTADTKAPSTDLTPQTITEPDQTFTVNTHQAVPFLVEDIAEVQSKYSIRQAYTDRAGYALARAMDVAGANLFDDNTTQTVGTLATELTDASMRRAWQYLTDSAAPTGRRYIAISPGAYAGLLNLDKYVARTYVGEESLAAVRQAKVGNIYGAEIYITQLTPGTAPSSSGQMWEHSHFFKIVQRSPTVHTEYRALSVGMVVVMDQIYGVFEKQEPDEAPEVTTDALLWGVRLQTIK